MPRYVVLLRGVNLGPRNRVAMPALREALEAAGLGDVRTYLQSGNVVLSSPKGADRVARECERELERGFGLQVDVVVRTRAELGKVVARNPLADVADDPKRYQVTFLAETLPRRVLHELESAATGSERVAVLGREVYAWHPAGVARSKLDPAMAKAKVITCRATARNLRSIARMLEKMD